MEPIITGPASVDDPYDIAVLGKHLWLELGYSDMVEYDSASVLRTCQDLQRNHVLLVSKDASGYMVGFAGAMVNPIFFNLKCTSISELFWWVDRKYREQGVGLSLIKGLEDEALSRKAKFVSPMLHTEAARGKAGEILQKLGYRPTEVTYTKEVTWEHSAQ